MADCVLYTFHHRPRRPPLQEEEELVHSGSSAAATDLVLRQLDDAVSILAALTPLFLGQWLTGFTLAFRKLIVLLPILSLHISDIYSPFLMRRG